MDFQFLGRKNVRFLLMQFRVIHVQSGSCKNSCSACFLLSYCVDAGIVFLAGITMFVRAAILLGVLDDVLTAKTGVTCVLVSLQVEAVN